jgi:hypothetical protein
MRKNKTKQWKRNAEESREGSKGATEIKERR